MQPMSVSKFMEDLNFKPLGLQTNQSDKYIVDASICIPGLELSGFLPFFSGHEIIIFGQKELAYLKSKNAETQSEILVSIIRETTPLILLADNETVLPTMQLVATQRQIDIVQSEMHTMQAYIKISDYLENYFAPKELFHGTLLEIYGQGVIVMGKSGIGKSEVALELIKKGHRLVADDAIIINRIGSDILGRAPQHLKNYLEVRGIGLIDVYKMFGINSVADYKTIRYVIELDHLEENQGIKRLDDTQKYRRILETDIPCATILVGGGRNIADLVEVAVTNLRLKAKGLDPVKELVNKHNQLLQGGKHDD